MKALGGLLLVLMSVMSSAAFATVGSDSDIAFAVEPAFVAHGNGAFLDSFDFAVEGQSNFGAQVVSFELSGLLGISDLVLEVLDSAYNVIAATTTNQLAWVLDSGSYSLSVSGAASGRFGGAYAVTAITTPVPEPSALLSLMLGLGVVGYAARRRSRQSSSAPAGSMA